MYRFIVGVITGALAYYWFGAVCVDNLPRQLGEWAAEDFIGLLGCAFFSGLLTFTRRYDNE